MVAIAMPVLVINCGSTSLKCALIDPETGLRFGQFKATRLNSEDAEVQIDGGASRPCPPSHDQAVAEILPAWLATLKAAGSVVAVGHRVVHGGAKFSEATLIDDEALEAINELAALAPLHNPANAAGIRAARKLLPEVPQVAVFDTAFHATLPNRARRYALPRDLAKKHGIQRYGFHGTSHRFIAQRGAEFLGEDWRQLRLITCHLGGGCSACAVEYGRSVETSMGMTPLEGLVMATRSGDVDPGALLHLMRAEDWSVDQLDELLNKQSGLAGLTQSSGDMRDIEARAEEGDRECQSALQIFAHRLRKTIGAYAAVMGGVDGILFSGGIGENSPTARHRASQRLEYLGARLDEDRNRAVALTAQAPVAEVSAPGSRVRLLAVRTDEAWEIARQVAARLGGSEIVPAAAAAGSPPRQIPVAISARHVHLTEEAVAQLFGEGHQLTPLKELSQPGQFAAKETVTLVGPKRQLERVRVLGPTRSKNQVEISRTDEFFLGMDAPVRASGDIENTPGITLLGTEERQLTLEKGVICAWRHIHMTPEDAEAFGVSNGDIVEVEVGGGSGRALTFGDVLVRVKSSYALEMHIDTDEGNAAELRSRDVGEMETSEATATMRRKLGR